jgi:glutamate synthase (NADPH/NADH) large chain
MKTGRDVVIAALLGAEEFGFATAPLVVSGCILMRVCHLDTCPVGVATQNPLLRKRFSGKPEFVVNFFEFLAEEIREILASLGFRSLEQAVGHTELLDVDNAISHWKADGLDLSPILKGSGLSDSAPRSKVVDQDHELEKHFDHKLIAKAHEALNSSEPVLIEEIIRNTEQAAGTLLGHHVTATFGEVGLPEATIHVRLRGTAGQSFGAFIPRGIKLELVGDANDHVGKGLSGGMIVVRPDENASFPSNENVIAGNVIGYGATSGQLFLSGVVGERFMVRNSGATAVVEGAGDHALEYMTGGRAVILGPVGRNLGAGMSGGYAYVYKLRNSNVNAEALSGDEIRLLKPSKDQAVELRGLIALHEAETKSRIATKMLENFDSEVENFSVVMPTDYASVQDILADAELTGMDPDGNDVWQKILEVTNG